MKLLKFPISPLYIGNESQYSALGPRQGAQEELSEPCHFSSLFLPEQPHSIWVLKEALLFSDIRELHLYPYPQNNGQHYCLSVFNKGNLDLYLIQSDIVQSF